MATSTQTKSKRKPADIAQLVRDLKQVNQEIQSLIRNKKPNMTVRDPDYLYPTISSHILPSADPSGLYAYYTGIRDALECAIMNGSIYKDILPKRAPQYLKDLVE